MPKRMSHFVLKEQPIQWGRALISGAVSAILMAAFIDFFYLLALTPFSFELYLGSLIRGTPYGSLNWVAGFLANMLAGSLFGLFYAYCFEYVFFESSTKAGLKLAFWHIIVAGIAFFPFFSSIHEFMNTGLYSHFGILGYGLGIITPLLLIFAHILFGLSMGTLYGPVREDRIQTRIFEPGETGLTKLEGGISEEEDPEDRTAA